jgi:hypothetical protein
MNTLWIRLLRAAHVWTGRRLQRHAVRRLVRQLEKSVNQWLN